VVGNCFSDDSATFGLFRTTNDAATAADILMSVVWDKADRRCINSNRFQLHLLANSGFHEQASQKITTFYGVINLPELNNWEFNSVIEKKKVFDHLTDQSNSYTSLVKDAGCIFSFFNFVTAHCTFYFIAGY
jgi:hypothetical protein